MCNQLKIVSLLFKSKNNFKNSTYYINRHFTYQHIFKYYLSVKDYKELVINKSNNENLALFGRKKYNNSLFVHSIKM